MASLPRRSLELDFAGVDVSECDLGATTTAAAGAPCDALLLAIASSLISKPDSRQYRTASTRRRYVPGAGESACVRAAVKIWSFSRVTQACRSCRRCAHASSQRSLSGDINGLRTSLERTAPSSRLRCMIFCRAECERGYKRLETKSSVQTARVSDEGSISSMQPTSASAIEKVNSLQVRKSLSGKSTIRACSPERLGASDCWSIGGDKLGVFIERDVSPHTRMHLRSERF